MKLKAVIGIVLMVLLVGVLMLAFNVQPTGASEPPPIKWTKTYGGIGDEFAWSMVQTLGGGYAIAGYTDSFGAGGKDFYLVKTDSYGNMEWNKTYGGVQDDSGRAMVRTLDGGYAIVGETFSFAVGMWDFWLVKVDSSGNHEWNQTYGGAGIDSAFSIVQTSDGGYALAGGAEPSGADNRDFWLVKVDSSGNHEWNQTYGGGADEDAWSMIQTSDGGYALAGFTHSFGAGNRDFYLVKTDSYGNMEWNKTYGRANYDAAYAGVIQRNDGGYALAGVAYSFGAGTWDFWLVKVDSSGNHEWNQTYGGANDDFAYSAIGTSDGGYALTGYTMSFGGGGTNLWLVKTDSSGNMQWNITYVGGWARSMVQTLERGYALAGGAGGDFWLVKVGPPPVGGIWIPVNKISLLAPYVISTITIILVASISVAYIKYRKKH